MRTLLRLERLEEELRTWGQGVAPKLSHREVLELTSFCDRILIERMRAQEVIELEGSMGRRD